MLAPRCKYLRVGRGTKGVCDRLPGEGEGRGRGQGARSCGHSGQAWAQPPMRRVGGLVPPGQQVAPVPVGLSQWPPPLPLLVSHLRAEASTGRGRAAAGCMLPAKEQVVS